MMENTDNVVKNVNLCIQACTVEQIKQVILQIQKDRKMLTEEQTVLINHKERESRLITEFKQKIQDINHDHSLEMEKVQGRIKKLIPDTIKLKRDNLLFLKRTGNHNFGIGRKDTLKFTHYVRGNQVVPLPKELCKSFKIILVAWFDSYHKIMDYSTLNRNHSALATYHSHGDHVCLGQDRRPFNNINLEDSESIHTALNHVKETIQVLNANSPLQDMEQITRNLRPTIRYVQEQCTIGNREAEITRRNIQNRKRLEADHKCHQCGKVSKGKEMVQRLGVWFCNETCYDIFNPKHKCVYCKKEYRARDSDAEEMSKFCSYSCEEDHSYENETLHCHKCKKEYVRKDSQAENTLFCTQECQNEHQRPRPARLNIVRNDEQPRNSAVANVMNEVAQEVVKMSEELGEENNVQTPQQRGWRVNQNG